MGKEIILLFFILIAIIWIFSQNRIEPISLAAGSVLSAVRPTENFTTLPTGCLNLDPTLSRKRRRKGNITFANTVKQRTYNKKTGDVSPETLIPINDMRLFDPPGRK